MAKELRQRLLRAVRTVRQHAGKPLVGHFVVVIMQHFGIFAITAKGGYAQDRKTNLTPQFRISKLEACGLQPMS
jgi:hypothetical protein